MKHLRIDGRSLRKQHIGQGVVLAVGIGSMAGPSATTAFAQSAAAPVAAPASAASAPNASTLEEVVITARKRAELEQDVPISEQSFSAKTLRDAAIFDLQDLKSYAGFTYNQTTGTIAGGRTYGLITFRGLQSDTGLGPDNSAGVFLDGIFISGSVSSLNTADVARVEVLKGPQNAFFGRSTFGGAVNFITRQPSNTFQGEFNSSVTARGSTDVNASVEGPLVDNLLSGRITAYSHNKVADYRATDGGDLGAEKTTGISGTLYATPTDKLWLRLRGTYQQDDDSAAATAYIPATTANGTCAGKTFSGQDAQGHPVTFTPGVPYFCGSIPTFSQVGPNALNPNTAIPDDARAGFKTGLGQPYFDDVPSLDHSGLRRDIIRGSFQAGLDLPYQSQFAFNMGFNQQKSMNIFDLDRTDVQSILEENALISRDFTVDARLSSDPKAPLRGLVGVSYFSSSFQEASVDYAPGLNYSGLFGSPGPFPTTVTPSGNFENSRSSVPALYGSVDYDILANVTATAEARYQVDKVKDYSSTGVEYNDTKHNILPRATLKYTPIPDTMVYASYAEGVQPLSLNAGYIYLTPAQRAYVATIIPGISEYTLQPKLDSYELGIKQTLLGDRVQYALAVFDEKWKNRATNSYLFNPPGCGATSPSCPLSPSGAFSSVGNDARIRGLEFSGSAILTKGWTVGGAADYLSAKWTRYSNYSEADGLTSGVGGFTGNHVARVPDWTASINSTYRQPLFGAWVGYVRGDAFYTGKYYESDFNFAKSDGYTRVNLRAGVDRGDLTLELFVTNLFDDNHWDSVSRINNLAFVPALSFSQQGVLAQAPDRREIGLRVHYAFQ